MSTFKPTWTPAKDFIDPQTGVVVRVNKTNHQVPQFSFETGRLRDIKDPKSFIQFLLVRVDRDDVTSGDTDTDQLEALHDMLDEAASFVKAEIKAASDKFREKREQQENEEQGPDYIVVSRENRGNRRRQSVPTVSASSESASVAA